LKNTENLFDKQQLSAYVVSSAIFQSRMCRSTTEHILLLLVLITYKAL